MTNRAVKAFHYLSGHEGHTISLKDMASEVGWKPSTIKTYATKKWKHYLVPQEKGLYRVEGLKYLALEDFLALHNQTSTPVQPTPKHPEAFHYDVIISYAIEESAFVEEVAKILEAYGMKVFYDDFYTDYFWQQPLYDYMQELLYRRSRFMVTFLSKNYARKLWTSHEKMQDQARFFRENTTQIIPARFDQTDLPGIDEPVAYLNLNEKSPQEVADGIALRLGFYEPVDSMMVTLKNMLEDTYHLEQQGDKLLFFSLWCDEEIPYRIEMPISVMLAFYKSNTLKAFLESDEFFPVTA